MGSCPVAYPCSLIGLAGIDKGQASFYLMLLTPAFTIIHHTIIVFLPTYRPSQIEFEVSPKGPNFSKPTTAPTHTGGVYLSFLILISTLWSISMMATFYVLGANVANRAEGPVKRTGPAECAFGVVEVGISWAIFVLCMNQRMFRYDGIPPA